MFQSIQHKLILPLCLLLLSVAGLAHSIICKEYIYTALWVIAGLCSFNLLNKQFKKFNQNILFLLNALDNGDYSFHFSVTKLSKREKELNLMLNRIKEIVANARTEVIANEKFLSTVVESVPTGIVLLDSRNNILNANQAALNLLGLQVFNHLNHLNKINPNFPDLFRNLQITDHTQIKLHTERDEVHISLRLSEIKTKQGLLKIITLNNIENELEAKEMESWVRLIRVMTHEIMNSIAPITSLSETMLSLHQTEHPSPTLHHTTVEAFETIHATAEGLLTFVDSYRKFTGIPKPVCKTILIQPLIERIVLLVSEEIKTQNILVNVVYSKQDLQIDADEQQICQVLINLMRNALHAVSVNTNKTKEIRIEVGQNNNTRTFVTVSNNGTPISEEVSPHIFIPFFTTKESGTGIGLSLSRYIMRLHDGNLKHHTSTDGWTVFSVLF